MDIGESLVGAYFRQVRHCHTIAFNQFLPGKQGEIDVIGISGNGPDQTVWLAEVALHLDGLNYGGNATTIRKIETKMSVAREYSRITYRDARSVLEFWSPVVPSSLASGLGELGVQLVINHGFTRRVNELASLAAASTKQYGDDAFRFLQVLTHLRGEKPEFHRTPPDDEPVD